MKKYQKIIDLPEGTIETIKKEREESTQIQLAYKYGISIASIVKICNTPSKESK